MTDMPDFPAKRETFVHVGKPASAVVISLEERAKLVRQLKGSVALETKKAEDRAERRRAYERHRAAQEGRDQITEGLRKVQMNDSPEAAIRFLQATLAAISGSTA